MTTRKYSTKTIDELVSLGIIQNKETTKKENPILVVLVGGLCLTWPILGLYLAAFLLPYFK